MSRAVGLFVDARYFPLAVACINSLRYYGYTGEIRVYDYTHMPHLLRSYLARHVTVVDVPEHLLAEPTYGQYCAFRPIILDELGIADSQICLDVDMVALCNLEEAFQLVEAGHFVGAEEWRFDADTLWGGKFAGVGFPRWEPILGSQAPRQFPVYNGGFLGFSRKHHADLLRCWRQAVCDPELYRRPYDTDQVQVSAVAEHWRLAGRITVSPLPRHLWMPTWHFHGQPPKVLKFVDGRPQLIESASGESLRLYHYTGGITKTVSYQPNKLVMRLHHAHGEDLAGDLVAPGREQEHRRLWYDLWERQYNSPAAILADRMAQVGPLKCPTVFNAALRGQAARVLRELYGWQHVTPHSRETLALCVAHDYVTLLGYRPQHVDWLDLPLRLLTDRPDESAETLTWGPGGDVELSFAEPDAEAEPWFTVAPRQPSEYLSGLLIRCNESLADSLWQRIEAKLSLGLATVDRNTIATRLGVCRECDSFAVDHCRLDGGGCAAGEAFVRRVVAAEPDCPKWAAEPS